MAHPGKKEFSGMSFAMEHQDFQVFRVFKEFFLGISASGNLAKIFFFLRFWNFGSFLKFFF